MPKRQTIGTQADIEEGLAFLRVQSTQLASIINQVPHVPLRRRAEGFESLASIIISQQVSKQSADAIFGRFKQLIDPLTPENYLLAGEPAWIEIGLSRPKQRTFSALANALTAGELELSSLSNIDADDAIAQLTQVKGIGPWTAEVYMLFAVGHRDIFPAGDLALQIAASDVYGHKERISAKDLQALAESWSPWRGVAARLFWAYYAHIKGKNAAP